MSFDVANQRHALLDSEDETIHISNIFVKLDGIETLQCESSLERSEDVTVGESSQRPKAETTW